MVRVKILEVIEHECQYDEYNYCGSIYTSGDMTDWECVTEQELDILKKWSNDNRNSGAKFVIISEYNISPKKTVSDYIRKIEEKNAIKAEKEKKKLEKEEKKKKKTLELNKQAKEKKLLEELQNKYCLVK